MMNTIKNKVKIIPTPVSGLALGIASLCWCFENIIDVNLISAGVIQTIGALIALFLIVPLIIKFIMYPHLLLDDLKNPVIGSVLPTLPMTLMVISKATGLYNAEIENTIWLIAVIAHLIFFIIFCYFRYFDFHLEQLIPSWFVPPIGIIVANVAFPDVVAFRDIGTFVLIFGMSAYLIMLPVMFFRFIFGPMVEDAVKPTIAIFAAPASLSLAGYLSFSQAPSVFIVALLLPIALLMTLLIYLSFFKLLKLPFTPGFAAFTFPMAIGSTALFKVSVFATKEQWPDYIVQWLSQIALFELVIATLVIGYVFICYLKHYRTIGLIP